MNAVNLEAPADAAAPDMVEVNGKLWSLHKHPVCRRELVPTGVALYIIDSSL